jgi:hypothetical protein
VGWRVLLEKKLEKTIDWRASSRINSWPESCELEFGQNVWVTHEAVVLLPEGERNYD